MKIKIINDTNDTSDKSDTSDTANSSDASKTSGSRPDFRVICICLLMRKCRRGGGAKNEVVG